MSTDIDIQNNMAVANPPKRLIIMTPREMEEWRARVREQVAAVRRRDAMFTRQRNVRQHVSPHQHLGHLFTKSVADLEGMCS